MPSKWLWRKGVSLYQFYFVTLSLTALAVACGDDKKDCPSGQTLRGGECVKASNSDSAPTETPEEIAKTDPNAVAAQNDTTEFLKYLKDKLQLTVKVDTAAFKKALKTEKNYKKVTFKFQGGWELDGHNTGKVETVPTVKAGTADQGDNDGGNPQNTILSACKAKMGSHSLGEATLSVSSEGSLVVVFPDKQGSDLKPFGADSIKEIKETLAGKGTTDKRVYSPADVDEEFIDEQNKAFRNGKRNGAYEKACFRFIYGAQSSNFAEPTSVIVSSVMDDDPNIAGGGRVPDDARITPAKDKNLEGYPKLVVLVDGEEAVTLKGEALKFLLSAIEPNLAVKIKGNTSRAQVKKDFEALLKDVVKELTDDE